MSTGEHHCLLSIIVPFYNNADYLQASLTSLFAQIDDDIEVVLVNDGSTDNSAAVVQQTLGRYSHSNTVSIVQDNGGIAHARNVGLQHARGRYVTFLDGDDILSQHYLSTLRPLLLSGEFELIDFNYRKFAGTPPEETAPAAVNCSAYAIQQQGLTCLAPLFGRAMWHLWNRVFHRTLLDGEQFEVGRRYEDVIFTPFIYFKTQKIAHLDQVLYFYRDNSYGITRNTNVQDIEDMLFAVQKMLAFAARPHKDSAVRQLAASMVLNGFNEIKAMSRRVYGYYFYPPHVRAVLKEAAALCEGTDVPKKRVWQMRYTQVDTLLSCLRRRPVGR